MKKYIVNATVQRVKRYNLTLEDLKATPVKFVDLERDRLFACIPPELRDSAQECILNYQSYGGLQIDMVFSPRTTPDDIRDIIKSLKGACAAIPERVPLFSNSLAPPVGTRNREVAAAAAAAANPGNIARTARPNWRGQIVPGLEGVAERRRMGLATSEELDRARTGQIARDILQGRP